MTTTSSPWTRGSDRSVTVRAQDDWWTVAACRDHDLDTFFPLNESRSDECVRGKEICAGCPVRGKCLAWSLRTGPEFGIFGGVSGPERRRLRGAGGAGA